MKTDRELLEGAAKSIGIALDYRHGSDAHYYDDPESGREEWLPTQRPEQAMLLVVRNRLCVSVESDVQVSWLQGDSLECCNEPFGDDEILAACRAVTRAAYEIGSAKP